MGGFQRQAWERIEARTPEEVRGGWLETGASQGDVEKWEDWEDTLEMEKTLFGSGLAVGVTQRAVKNGSEGLGPAIGKLGQGLQRNTFFGERSKKLYFGLVILKMSFRCPFIHSTTMWFY